MAVGIEKIVFSEYSPYENITAGTSANMSYIPFFFFLDLKIKRCGDIWSMMNSYQDVPYIYQNNLLSEKNKIMGVHYFRKFSLIVVPLLEIQGIPLEHPLPHDGRKKLEEKPLDCSLQSFHNCRFQLMGQLDL